MEDHVAGSFWAEKNVQENHSCYSSPFYYVGFIVINLEVLEFILDGLLGTHRLFAPALGSFYNVLMNLFEILAVLVLFSCVVFLIRRNIIRVPRFTKPEMKGWPAADGNLILLIEIILMSAILTMNAADQSLQTLGSLHYPETGPIFFSAMLKASLQNAA